MLSCPARRLVRVGRDGVGCAARQHPGEHRDQKTTEQTAKAYEARHHGPTSAEGKGAGQAGGQPDRRPYIHPGEPADQGDLHLRGMDAPNQREDGLKAGLNRRRNQEPAIKKWRGLPSLAAIQITLQKPAHWDRTKKLEVSWLLSTRPKATTLAAESIGGRQQGHPAGWIPTAWPWRNTVRSRRPSQPRQQDASPGSNRRAKASRMTHF
jgi:hypothetical protein